VFHRVIKAIIIVTGQTILSLFVAYYYQLQLIMISCLSKFHSNCTFLLSKRISAYNFDQGGIYYTNDFSYQLCFDKKGNSLSMGKFASINFCVLILLIKNSKYIIPTYYKLKT
jgi:hypothetical protein